MIISKFRSKQILLSNLIKITKNNFRKLSKDPNVSNFFNEMMSFFVISIQNVKIMKKEKRTREKVAQTIHATYIFVPQDQQVAYTFEFQSFSFSLK